MRRFSDFIMLELRPRIQRKYCVEANERGRFWYNLTYNYALYFEFHLNSTIFQIIHVS